MSRVRVPPGPPIRSCLNSSVLRSLFFSNRCYHCAMGIFKKKSTTPAPLNIGILFVQLGTELYRDLGKADGTSSLSATLEFDNQQRIVNIKNPLVDGVPKVPSFDT